MKHTSSRALVLCLIIVLGPLTVHAGTPEENEAVYRAYMQFGDMVEGGSVTPGWILGGPSFWYAEGGPQNTAIYRVDPVANTREELFDVPRLREALTEALGHFETNHHDFSMAFSGAEAWARTRPADLRRVAAEVFCADNRTTVVARARSG